MNDPVRCFHWGLIRSIAMFFSFVCVDSITMQIAIGQDKTFSPTSLEFRRQATRRMIFDSSEDIPLSSLEPAKVIGFDLMYPALRETGEPSFSIENGCLNVTSAEKAKSDRWLGGFNPFATYEVSLRDFIGSGRVGLKFCDAEKDDYISVTINATEGVYQSLRWSVVVEGSTVESIDFPWPSNLPSQGSCCLRVQMMAVGANIYIESEGQSHLVGFPDFVQHLELRNKAQIFRFVHCLEIEFDSKAKIAIENARSALTPGCGQADIRAITTSDGVPLFDDGRIWLTMTVRGRALPHPLQGVFSMNPSVFDLRFEGIIVFDMGDGLWRNELASHIFFDEHAKQWRGWTTGFSALGTKSKEEQKQILAIWSEQDPRRGFSIMNAAPIGLDGQHEDPHGVYDAEAKKWRLLLSEKAGKYRAGMWESDHWNRGFERLAGPVEMDSTGTLIQAVEGRRYVFFGSADRKVYIRSYPDLGEVGELKMYLPPWNEYTGTRIWPNIIPLPKGYPVPYIALMMDRQNFPNMPSKNWTYGAMYLYHAQFR